jgi:hypothetical protein
MGAGNKKNKRHSVSPNTEQQLIERTAENDYGVLSDPDETAITTSTVTAMEAATATATAVEAEAAMEANRLNDDIHTEQLTLSDSQQSLPPSSPLSSQEQPPSKQSSSPLLQSQIPESQLSPSNKKSLIALQLKLTRDKNFSRKITLHTFFSYIILALEMERASSASIARISPNNVQHLIEYMIEHHSETEAVRIYLQTLIDTGVVKNLIESVIEFNKDQTEAFNKLLTSEQLELEISSIQEDKRTAKSVEVAADNEQGPAPAPQTSQDSMTTRIRNFFKRCVCCCQPRRRRQQERRNNEEELKTQTPAVEEQNKPDTSENERTGENERVKCEQP